MNDILIAIAIIWVTLSLSFLWLLAIDCYYEGIEIGLIEVGVAIFWLPILVYILVVVFFNLLSRHLHATKRH